MEKILELIKPRFQTEQQALDWFNNESLPSFSGLTAKQLVDAGREAEILEFIRAVDAGVHA